MTDQPYVLGALLSILIGVMGCSGNAVVGSANPPDGSAAVVATTPAAPLDYRDYAEVLAQYVDDQGFVNYAGLKANRQPLDTFNRSLGQVSPATYEAWSEADQLAFLINAYNALTLASIIDRYPVASIRDIPGVWKQRKFQVASQAVTLDDIEHNTIRPFFSEPRIHFAVNCASIGCPILLNVPYRGSTLDQQLEQQTQLSLADERHLRIDRAKQRVYLSSVFKWFGEDWVKTQTTAPPIPGLSDRESAFIHFVSQYVDADQRQFLMQGGYQVSYTDWDWSLNVQS